MDDAPKKLLSRLLSAYREGSRLALLFDYDGTLTPIVEHPSMARLQQRTLHLLGRLGLSSGISVGIISGRSLDDLQSMVDIPSFYYAGTTGLELDLRGDRVIHPQVENYLDLIATMVKRLTEMIRQYPGAWVEDKRLSLTLHYRKLDRRHHVDLIGKARTLVALCSEDLRITQGPMALEVVPDLSWDKGSAVRQILEAIGQPLAVIYAGDAANDSEALATVAGLGGIAVAVGSNAPENAHYRLEDSDTLVSFLGYLDEAITRERPPVGWATAAASS